MTLTATPPTATRERARVSIRPIEVVDADGLSDFYASLSPIEQDHMVEAFTFELSKCYEQAIRERMLGVLANVDTELTAKVAAGLGLPAPEGKPPVNVTPLLLVVSTGVACEKPA